MNGNRYRSGGAEQQLPACCAEIEEISDPTEKRYATLGSRGNLARRRDRTGGRDRLSTEGRDRPATEGGRRELRDPLLEIARHDEQHHYGRQSVERRDERLAGQRRRQEQGHVTGASSRPAERRYHRYGSQF